MGNATRHPNHGGRRREQMVGDVPTVVVRTCLLPDQMEWLGQQAQAMGISRSAVIRQLIEGARAGARAAGALGDAG